MAEDIQENDEDKKSSKKLIIIIIILLLIIAGGGVAFYLMSTGDSATQAEETEQVEQEEDDDDEAEQASKDIIYYDLDQPLRVNFPKGSSASLIEVRIAFLIKSDDAEEALEKHEPMIVNNLLMAISAAGADNLKTTEGKNQLRALMREETGKVLEKMTGKNSIKEVFFTTFVMQ